MGSTFYNRDKMWFGTSEFMQWIDTPNTGADVSSLSFSVDSTMLNGGGYARNSWDSHKTYQFSWGQSASMALSHAINAYRNGSWGRGLIYFHDPMTYGTNILPKRWADPSMAVNYEAAPIIPDVFPTATPAAPGMLGLPVTTATYPLPSGYSSQANGSEHFIPIPPDMTLLIGATYSGGGKLYIRVDGNAPVDIPTLDAASLAAGSAVNFKVTGQKAYLGIRNTTGAATSITIQAITARLADTSRVPVYMGVPTTNLLPNPSFETASGTIDTITNLFTNPSFETGSGTVEVRRNYNLNPKMFPTTANWNTTSPTMTMTATAAGTQIDVVTGPTSLPLVFNSADIACAPGENWSASVDVTNPAGFPAASINLRIYAYGQAATVSDSGTVTIQPGQTVTIVAPSGTALASNVTGIRMIVYGAATPTGARLIFKNALLEKVLTPGPYFDGSTPPTLRTNFCMNPSFEAGAALWTPAAAGSAISTSTTTVYRGTRSLQVVTDGSVANQGAYCNPQATSLTPGTLFSASARVLMPAGQMFDISAYSIGTGLINKIGTYSGTGAWQYVEASGATLGASQNPYVIIRAQGTAAITFYVDDVMIDAAPTARPYLDGAFTKPGFGYAFTGTANASPSIEWDADLTASWTGTANGSASILTGVGVANIGSTGAAKVIISSRWNVAGAYSARIIPTGISTNVGGAIISPVPPSAASGGTIIVTSYQEAPITGPLWIYRGKVYTNPTSTTYSTPSRPNEAGAVEQRLVFGSGQSNIVLTHGGTAGSGDVWYDLATLVAGTYDGPAFTGDSTSTDPDMVYAWTGTPHASTSALRGTGVASYVGTGGAIAIQSSTGVRDGVKSVRIIPSTGGDTSAQVTVSGLSIGQTYTILGYVTLTAPITASSSLSLGFWVGGATTPPISYTAVATNSPGTYEVRGTFVAGAASHNIRFYNGSASPSDNVYWDTVALVSGDYAGPWGAGTFTTPINIDEGRGPWFSGEGHSGARFIGTPSIVNYNGIDGGQLGLSCTLKEVGAWV